MAIIPLPVKFLTQNLKPPWAASYLTTNFGGTYSRIYACFEHKTAFVMQNFRNLGASGGGRPFFDKTPKSTSLISLILSHCACRSVHGFFSRSPDEKKGNYKKSRRGYISPIRGEFPTLPNLTKIGF